MRRLFILLSAFIVSVVNAQDNDAEIKQFLNLFTTKIKTLDAGKIEPHYEEGYFITLSESVYFDKDNRVELTSLYQDCMGKDEATMKKIISRFFDNHKELKVQRKEIEAKMDDFNFIRPYLKIRVFSEELLSLYSNHAITRFTHDGLLEVVVLDLPSGIGSLDKKYLATWKKTEEAIYRLARINTLKALKQKFEKAETAKTGEVFYILADDMDLFITSAVLDLRKAGLPLGKHGTVFSVPNHTSLVAMPLDDPSKADGFILNFMGLTDYMNQRPETKPVSNNLFWYDGKEVFLITKDIPNKKFIYPAALQTALKQ